MMRTSELYKTTYTEMFQRMKTLEQKFPSLSPALMSLMLDYSKIAATSEDRNSSNRKRQSPNKRLAKAKKPRKVKEQKRGQKQKSPPMQPKNRGEDHEAVSTPSLTNQSITPTTEPTTEPTIDDWWLDYTQLMEDIERKEKQTTDITAADSSSGIMDDLYQEDKLTPLQKKNKKPESVLKAFKEILKTRQPKKVRTDAGSEFRAGFDSYLKKKNITHTITQNENIKSSSQLVNGKPQPKLISSDQSEEASKEVKVKLQVTSEPQSVVERADAKEKRQKSLKRAAGERVATTKRIRLTSNTPSKTARVFKSTPVNENDIFG
ncbi:muscle M-line assembly protein unc-89-like [Haliotis asinina]|uniref:muscle M-line assembly protein unc-89-like n=1 Tax=Haliotis asinina TaxID=109174 RepID=UPI00353209F1